MSARKITSLTSNPRLSDVAGYSITIILSASAAGYILLATYIPKQASPAAVIGPVKDPTPVPFRCAFVFRLYESNSVHFGLHRLSGLNDQSEQEEQVTSHGERRC